MLALMFRAVLDITPIAARAMTLSALSRPRYSEWLTENKPQQGRASKE